MIQGCFSYRASPAGNKSNVPPITATTNTSKESLITCIYQTRLLDSLIYLTLTWSKTPNSHTLTIHAPDCFSITLSLHHSPFSLFRTRSSSKTIRVDQSHNYNCYKIKLHYDFTRAEFTRPNSAEPGSRFYLALVHNGRVEFSLGDAVSELTRRLGLSRLGDSVLLSRREHVFGRRSFSTLAEFLGSVRTVEIECSGGAMKVKIDGETKLHVKRLAWKFRGNEKIFINGIGVEFYWDIFNWVNNNKNNNIGGESSYGQQNGGNGVFVFQVGDGGVCPEMVGPEKKLMRKSSPALSPAGSGSSVWQWAEENSDCGRSSSGSSSITTRSSGSCGGGGGGGGFSLVLYAWERRIF